MTTYGHMFYLAQIGLILKAGSKPRVYSCSFCLQGKVFKVMVFWPYFPPFDSNMIAILPKTLPV